VSVHAAGELDARLRRGGCAAEQHDRNGADRPYYFTGKNSIFAFGCAVPFGLTARQMDAWMEHGNGRKLMDAFYANYNIKSRSAATPAPRWAAGTARKSSPWPTSRA
jgi:TRAP-type mannitol/chloroaromatic compound transport system substrate-binding protein